MYIKKFNDFLNESNVSETDIREFLKEEFKEFKSNLFTKIISQYSLDNTNLNSEYENKVDKLLNQLSEIYVLMITDNMKDFQKSWELPKDKMNVGDEVYSKTNK